MIKQFIIIINYVVLLYLSRVSGERQAFTEKTACEGDSLQLACRPGQSIRIKLANYGRFALGVCNDDNKIFHNTHCSWAGSVAVMEKLCNGQVECQVEATNEVFVDSCPDTFKYLVVQWYCDKMEPRTTTNSTAVPKTTTVVTPKILISQALPQKPKEKEQGIEYIAKDVVHETVPQVCPSRIYRKIEWPETLVNHSAKKSCPNLMTEYAEWNCGVDGVWVGTPDLHRCVSPWVYGILDGVLNINTNVDAVEVARNLQAESTNRDLFGGDVVKCVEILQDVVSKASALLVNRPAQEKQWTSDQISQYTVDILSGLLNSEHEEAWNDLPDRSKERIAVGILEALDANTQLLANSVEENDNTKPKLSHNIQLEVSVVQIQDYVKFPSRSLYDPTVDNILIPKEALQNVDLTIKTSGVSFTSISKLGQYLNPSPRQVTLKNGTLLPVNRKVVSNIVGASVDKVGPIVDLLEPVFIAFNTPHDEKLSNPECVYWDKTMGNIGSWSPDGCLLVSHNKTHTTCACDHLTHFAVLMDVTGVVLPWEHELGLSFVTYIGCVVSIMALVASIFTLNLIRDPSDRITIQKHLCFCLLVAEIIFIFGIRQMGYKLACSVIAGLLHYFFLASFAWMFLEGVHLYRMLTDIFNIEVSRRCWYYLFAYGLPAVIVGISAGVGYENYGTSRYCWLRTDNLSILAFVVPVMVVLFFNLIFLLIALGIMCRHASFKSGYRHCQHKSTPENIGSWLKGAMGLVVLLGLTWSFGLGFIIYPAKIYIMYIFSVLNSLQGLFIFLFYVLCNENVKRSYRRWLQRTSWLPDCWRDQGFEGPSHGHIGMYRDLKGKPAYNTDSCESRPSASSPLPGSVADSTHSYTAKLLLPPKTDPRYNSAAQLLLARSNSVNNASPYDYALVGVNEDVSGFHNGDIFVPTYANGSPYPVGVVYRQIPRLPPPNIPPPDPPYYAVSIQTQDDSDSETLRVYDSARYERPTGVTPIPPRLTPLPSRVTPIPSRIL